MTRGRARSRLLGTVGAGTVVVLLCQTAAASASPVGAAVPVGAETSTYVVQGEDLEKVTEVLAGLGVTPEETFDELGSLTVDLAPQQLASLEAAPAVDAVSPEHVYSVDATQTSSTPWGLDRLDQAGPTLDGRFTYDDKAGQGVRVYVVDTGVTGGTQLSGRLAAGTNTTGDANGTADCHGHGTHVAGIAAGTTFGVAKKATVVPVRVLGCTGGGTTSTVIAGLDWIASTHPAGVRGVVNLSLGGPRDTPLDAAVEALEEQGFVVVAAAGNETADACTKSPAGAPSVLTVGASDEHDARADFSNYGPCLDLFAPGNRIVSTSLVYESGAELRSGTSMAAPHVAGVAALALSRHPSATPAQVAQTLTSSARQVVTGASSTTRGLLSADVSTLTTSTLPSPTPTPGAGAPAAPGGLTLSGATLTGLTASWTASAGATSYRLQRSTNGSTWSDVTLGNPAATSHTVGSLSSGTAYWFRVSASSGGGTSSWSSAMKGTTLAKPSAPQSVRISWKTPTRTIVSWAPPATSPDLVTHYAVQVSKDGKSWTTVGIVGSTTRSRDLTGLAAGTKNWVRVASRIGSTTATWSSSTTFTAARASTRNERWFERAHRHLLGRSPDTTNVTTWGRKATTAAARTSIAQMLTANASARDLAVTGYVTTYLDRRPTSTELAAWRSKIAAGTSLTAVEAQVLGSAEHYRLAGGTPAAWVDRAYRDALGRPSTASERSTWVPVAATPAGRQRLASALAVSSEHLGPYIDGRFRLLLGRPANATERQTWITDLKRGVPRERLDAQVVGGGTYWAKTS